MGINWTDLRKNGSYSFSGCKLDYGCFQNMDLRNYEFLDCSIREADFSGANLEKAKITNCILSGTSFANVNLEKADLRNSKSYFIDPKYAKLKQAKFTLPEAVILLEAMGIEVGY
jgi:uncharacterized protein YjbI with pentapeptide repeats